MRMLAIAAGMFVACGVQAKLVKPSGGSSSGNLVISKVFYAGSIRLNGATPKNYLCHLYIELYNNSADTLNAQGLYIALTNSDATANAWTAADMDAQHKDSAVVKQIFQISPNAEYRLDPGKSIVLTNCAINHSEIAEGNVDLSDADFETKSTNKAYDFHGENVDTLKVISTFGTTDFINFMNPGPTGIILLASDTKLENCPKTFAKGKETGNQYTIVPLFKTIDCVDIVKQKTPSADDKRIATSYDAGFTCTDSIGTFNGRAVVRKTAFVTSDGRMVLFDTNNSSVDFTSTSDLSPRSYSKEPVGLIDSTIVIPESGYAAVNITRPFCGPKNVVFCYVSASNNDATTDLKYNEFPGDSLLLLKGDWIAIAQPGTYTIKLSESQGIMKTRSTSQEWTDESKKELTGSKKTRRIYKFTNAAGRVGFQRDETYASVKWNTADFAADEHLFITLTDAIGTRIFAANGADSYDNLSFIPWHGITPEQIKDGIETLTLKTTRQHIYFDLQGRRINGTPQKGLYIVDGKKIFVKPKIRNYHPIHD
jgi:hypothetical protein